MITRSVITFADAALAFPSEQLIRLNEPRPGLAPSFVPAEAIGDRDLAELRQRYLHGEMLGFRIPITIEQKLHGTHVRDLSFFDVFLQKGSSGTRSQAYFIRDGLSVLEEGRLSGAGELALLLAAHAPLARFLGDAENPAHTRWNERSEFFRRRGYTYAPSTLRYVKNSVSLLARFLGQVPMGLQKDLLQDVFYVPGRVGTKGGQKTPIPRPDVQSRPAAFTIGPVEGGVVVRGTASERFTPASYRVQLAYRTRRTSGMRYSPLDFQLQNMSIDCTGCAAAIVAGNELTLAATSPDFSLRVQGFDNQRDLLVQVTEV